MTERPEPEEIDELFRTYQATKRRRLRNRLVEIHMGLAHHIAGRYLNRGVADDDLRQVALLALVKAVDRFDPDNGAAFSSFAGRTIEGEIKHHFRDATWAVRVPRSAKEMHLLVRRATEELHTKLKHSPSVSEVADHLDVDRDAVVQALGASAAFSPAPLTTSSAGQVGSQDRSAHLAEDDAALEATADRMLVARLIEGLPEREQEIIRLRFYDELSQSDIAERVDVSQMHVSRLLRRALAAMKAGAGDASRG